VVWRRVGGLGAAVCLLLAVDTPASAVAQSVTKNADGSLMIAGRSLRCGKARNVVDANLPNLGLAAPGVLVMNPRLLARWPDIVRLFVFHHECGHHHVGASETGADCWAVKEGVRQGWLDQSGLQQICRSFGNGPATSTHPSGASRCASLQRCYAGATSTMVARKRSPADGAATLAKERSPAAGEVTLSKERERSTATGEATSGPAGPDAPKLLNGPDLKRSGMNPE
jgi:hypothetical protein